jgi:general nucleoside transport system permease protein
MSFLQSVLTGKSGRFLVPVLSIVLGMAGAGIIISLIGVNPAAVYGRMFTGAFGTANRIFSTLQRFTSLSLAALAVTLAFKAGVFNIGVEGQIYIGALLATWAGVSFTGLPAIVHVPLAAAAGCLGGAVWAFIPGYLKAVRGFNEIIISIFMNFIAVYLLGAAVNTFLKAPGQGIPWSLPVGESARIPRIPGTTVHSGLILTVLIAIGIGYLLKHRTFGYELKATGLNRDAARYGGINTTRVTVITMMLSGAVGSLTGSMEILGVQHRLTEGFLVNYGYNAVPIALLGGLNPAGTLIVAFVYGALLNGASSMQIALKVPVSIVQVIMALAILASIGMNGLQHIVLERGRKLPRGC